jgi:hypothetical protein
MRTAGNTVAHEYPDNPELVAHTLNLIATYYPKLVAIKENLFRHMEV